jgi:hypothetical protein
MYSGPAPQFDNELGLENDTYLAHWLNMECPNRLYWRWQLLSFLGITEADVPKPKEEIGEGEFRPLEALNAKNLFGGSFSIKLVKKASSHLTCGGTPAHPVLKLLSLEKVKMLYIPQRVGIAK